MLLTSYSLLLSRHLLRSIRIVLHSIHNVYITLYHSPKERRDSLKGTLDRVLFAGELDLPKILELRLPQNSLNVNIEWAGIYLHFIILIIICFSLLDYSIDYSHSTEFLYIRAIGQRYLPTLFLQYSYT